MISFKNYVLLLEKISDIPTTNKMYHQTNAYSLFKKLERGYLLANDFETNLKNLSSLYSNEKGNKELSLGRKSLYTKLDAEKNREKMLGDFPNFGGVRFEIFMDRLKSSNAVRGVKVKQIAEYPLKFKKDLKEDLSKAKPDITDSEVEKLINSYNDVFYAPNHIKKAEYIKIGALKQLYPYLNKFHPSDFTNLLKYFEHIRKSQVERESEERLEFTKKNRIDKNELFSDYNDRLYLNKDFMKIVLLPDFFDDFLHKVSPHSFIKYYNKVKQWKSLFEENATFKKFMKFLRDFAAGRIDDEVIINKVDKNTIENYLKKYGKKTFIPSVEERQAEKAKFNYKTGGAKRTKEELQKEILSSWKKRS